jgi:hypothetical protein
MPSPLDRFLGDNAGTVDLDAREREASENLRALVSPEPYGIENCEVTDVHAVNEGPEGEPVVVPVARFAMGSDRDEPDLDVVWDLAHEAVRALYPAFEGAFVRHYDAAFTFGGGLVRSESCRRVAVSREIAERVVTEPGFGVAEFRAAMLEGHTIDDEVAPVAWGERKSYNRGPYDSGGSGAGAGGAF